MIAQLAPLFAGVATIDLTCRRGLQWPVPSTAHPASVDARTVVPKGRARFIGWSISRRRGAQRILSAGIDHRRILQHYNCGAQTRRTDIMQVVDTDVLEVHASDAARLDVRDGELVRLISARGGGTAAH